MPPEKKAASYYFFHKMIGFYQVFHLKYSFYRRNLKMWGKKWNFQNSID